MAWFVEKTMRFRFKYSDFDLYINILTIFKFQKGRLSFTMTQATLPGLLGGGPRVVVSAAAFHARVRGSVPGLGGLKGTKNVSSPATCESQYCGEPP